MNVRYKIKNIFCSEVSLFIYILHRKSKNPVHEKCRLTK